jgi:hypothetical protein
MAQTVLRTRSAHHNPAHQTVQYLYRRFNFNDIDQSATQPAKFCFGVLPAHCIPLETYVRVNIAFASGDLMCGTSVAASSGAVVSTGDILSGTTGTYVVDRYMGTYSTVDVPLYCQTATSGATAGQADVWQAFLLAYPAT